MKSALRKGLGAAVFFAGAIACVAGPKPEWAFPELPARAVFTPRVTERPFSLLLLPPDGSLGRADGARAADAEGRPLPFRVVPGSRDPVAVVVRTGSNATARLCALYYGGQAATAIAATNVVDPEPVRVDIFQAPGQGIPETWPRMRYLYAKSSHQTDVEYLSGFRPEMIAGDAQKRGRRKRDREFRWIVRLRTFVLCDRDGAYRFGVRCRNSAFLFLDGVPVATRPIEAREQEWTEGAVCNLKAGVYRLEAYHCTGPQLAVEVGWMTPGVDRMVPLPDAALVAADEASDTRLERMDRAIHADFTWDLRPSYTYRDSATTFIPVRFRSTSETWIEPRVRVQWDFGDGVTSDEPAPVHVYDRPGVWRVRLQARDAMGFTNVCEKRVDGSLTEPEVLQVGGRIRTLPAVCFADDRIAPSVELLGDKPPFGTLSLFTAVSGTGTVREAEAAVTLPHRWDLDRVPAGNMSRFRWVLRHGTAAIGAGDVVLARAPFSMLPVSVRAEGLYAADETRLVLLPFSGPDGLGTCVPWPSPLAGDLLVIGEDPAWRTLTADGMGPLRDRLGSAAGQAKCVAATLEPWDRTPDSYGPLLKLVQVPAAVTPGTRAILLGVGYGDYLSGTAPGEFERHVAALADLVSGSLRLPVLWVTLPPYGGDPDRARPYVEAVVRVAYRRRMPVADLFTAFQVHPEAGALLDAGGLSLTRAGELLVLNTVADAVRAAAGGVP